MGAVCPLTGALFVRKYGNSSCRKDFSACSLLFKVSSIVSISLKPTGPKVCRHSTKRLMWVPRISWGKSTASVTFATVCCVPFSLSRNTIGQRKSLMPTCLSGTRRKSFSPCTSFKLFTSVNAPAGTCFPNFYFIQMITFCF